DALGAVGFIAVTLLALSSASVSMIRGSKRADTTSAATALGMAKLEELRSMPLGAMQLRTGTYSDATTLRADGVAGGIFHRSWTVSNPDQPRRGLKTVT